ncbi:glycerate kinase, partial [Tessaracoccus lubricantis]
MRVVIAPDTFKSTMTAVQAARAISDGWADVRPGDRVTLRPMADGGEGTLDAFASLAGAQRLPLETVDALGELRQASWVRLEDGTGVVELAHCCGLGTIGHLAPREAHTYGFGLAIRAALDAGVRRLLLALGGSASTDGGLGLLVALGLGVGRDPRKGTENLSLPRKGLDVDNPHRGPESVGISSPFTEHFGNAALQEVTEVDWAGVVPLPEDGALVLSDVTNPLLGPFGAAAVFGPQKGGASLVAEMDQNLARWAALVGGDPNAPGAGAA